jgi:hypothetical protein
MLQMLGHSRRHHRPMLRVSTDSPTEPQPDLRKDDEGIDSLFENQGHDSRVPPRTPPSAGLSLVLLAIAMDLYLVSDSFQARSSFPGWRISLSPSFPHDHGSPWPNGNQRKFCEYCRFRKECSGYDTCFRYFRVGIDCVYISDPNEKRMADSLLDVPPPFAWITLPPSRFLPRN